MSRPECSIISPETDVAFITQNVDGLSRRALHNLGGYEDPDRSRRPNPKLYEMHGNLDSTICSDCRKREPVDMSSSKWDHLKKAVNSASSVSIPLEDLPHCACGGLVRPGVVW